MNIDADGSARVPDGDLPRTSALDTDLVHAARRDAARDASDTGAILRADVDELRVALIGLDPDATITVSFDGRPIWSTTLPEPHRRVHRLPWPEPLRPHLRGSTRLTVTDAATASVVAGSDVTFDDSPERTTVVDANGKALVVNKWGVLGAVVTADEDLRQRLIARTAVLCDDLETLGYDVAITSGTLLGLVRDGRMLPNDDDSDLSVIFPDSSPADLVLRSYRMERELADAGYTVVRHSGAHLQVTFLIDGGDIDHYIDIFTGFFRGEDFCQPFHLRAPVPRSSLLPTVRVEWEGVQVPAPPVPEDWLAACYGADWRTPDPAFHFETPSATRRRYENWFGSFNTGRVHWESYYSSVAAPEHLDGQQRYLRSARALLPAGGSVLDLGTGSGAIAAALAGDGRRVLGVDYSLKAVALARSAGVDAEFLNLNERRRVDQLAVRIRADPSPWSISAAFVLHTLTGETRSAVFGLIRSALRHPSPEPRSAVVAVDTVLDEDAYSFDDPSSWHLPVETLADELEPHGLSFRIERDGVRTTPHGEREFVVGTITLTTPTQEENR